MPNRFLDASGGGQAAPSVNLRTTNRFLTGGIDEDIAPEPPPASDSPWMEGSTVAKVGVGAAALAGLAALAAKMPGRIGGAARGLNAIRQQLMLSGMALPKSMLGNAGAALEASVEAKSLRPLSELFSMQTAKDAVRAYKTNSGLPGAAAGAARQVALPGPTPGRVMGALDEATQGALRRSGMAAKEAENATLQSPLEGNLAEALDSPMARYVHPFRRTPFNQFIEGWKRMPWGKEGSAAAKAAYMGAGAVHGAATSDDAMPMSIPLAIAGSARYGLPYGVAALIARSALGGKGGGGIASNVLPVGEYGFEQSLSDPTRPFTKPAAFTALERITGK